MAFPVDLDQCYLIETFGTTAGRTIPHTGDDWARKRVNGKVIAEAPDIRAVFAGTVVFAGWHGVAGNRVIIRYWFGLHGDYGHMRSIAVKVGQTVKESEKIGELGGTGKVTGPHLHYTQSTDLNRLLKGVYPYWKDPKTGRVLWASVDAWAKASGLQRPNYAIGSQDSKANNPLEEDDMALTPEQAAALNWLGDAERRRRIDVALSQTDQVWARRGNFDQIPSIAAAVKAPKASVDVDAVVDELVARLGKDAVQKVADRLTERIDNG